MKKNDSVNREIEKLPLDSNHISTEVAILIPPTSTYIDVNECIASKAIRELRVKNINKVIIAQLNINSPRNKFEFLLEIVNDVDILLIVETKLDISYHMNQFRIQGFQHFRLDRSSKGGGLIMYIRDTIPAKQLTQHQIPKDFEAIIIDINLWKVKWLLCGSYNPKENTISYHLDNIAKVLDYYIHKYDNLLLLKKRIILWTSSFVPTT